MKRTISWTALAWKSVITLTLTAFGFFTASTVAQGTGSESAGSEPCNLAIVSKTRVKGRTCDVKTIRELARDGHVYEQNQLGIASILAITPDYSTQEAWQWFERAAQRGYAPAQVNLAVMYVNGWGTGVNYGRALHWLQLAIAQNYPKAYFDLGILYLRGRGVAQGYSRAAELFRKGAEGGDANAQSNLGYMYDRGLGITQDTASAVAWYRKAADGGSAMGQNNLADMYLRGDGVSQDDKLAFALFQQAAVQGHTGARIKLGYMYAEGRGTKKDPETAYMWIAAAEAAGDQRGRDLLQSLEQRLTANQKAEAGERGRNLQPAPEADVSARMLAP